MDFKNSLIIGLCLLLGLIVATLIFLNGILWPEDREVTSDESIEKELKYHETLQQEIDDLAVQSDTLLAESAQTESLEGEVEQEKETFRKLEMTLLAKEDDLKRKEAILNAYETYFKPKISYPESKVFPVLETISGQKLENATFVGITEDSANIRHSKGIAQVPFRDLPSSLLKGSVMTPKVSRPQNSAKQIMELRPNEVISREIMMVIDKQDRASKSERNEMNLLEDELEGNRSKAIRIEEDKRRHAALQKEAEENRIKNDQINVEIGKLRKQISTQTDYINQYRSSKSRRIASFSQAKIKPDRIAHETALANYDAQVRKAQLHIDNLSSKISALNGQKSYNRLSR